MLRCENQVGSFFCFALSTGRDDDVHDDADDGTSPRREPAGKAEKNS